jgi:predicted DNA-binding protein (MmcQ/YjbR family)
MTLQRIREICLALPGATEQIQWGNDLVFKVGGKMFCVACTEPVVPPKVAMSFKCDDETYAALVEHDGVLPAPYLARAKWVALQQFDTLHTSQLVPLITRAFEIVSAKLPKKRVAKKANPSTRTKAAKARPSRSPRAGTKKPKRAAKTKKIVPAKAKTAKKPARRAMPARGRRAR